MDKEKRVSWTIRIAPKYKREIAIEAANRGCTVAQIMEALLNQRYSHLKAGDYHEAYPKTKSSIWFLHRDLNHPSCHPGIYYDD